MSSSDSYSYSEEEESGSGSSGSDSYSYGSSSGSGSGSGSASGSGETGSSASYSYGSSDSGSGSGSGSGSDGSSGSGSGSSSASYSYGSSDSGSASGSAASDSTTGSSASGSSSASYSYGSSDSGSGSGSGSGSSASYSYGDSSSGSGNSSSGGDSSSASYSYGSSSGSKGSKDSSDSYSYSDSSGSSGSSSASYSYSDSSKGSDKSPGDSSYSYSYSDSDKSSGDSSYSYSYSDSDKSSKSSGDSSYSYSYSDSDKSSKSGSGSDYSYYSSDGSKSKGSDGSYSYSYSYSDDSKSSRSRSDDSYSYSYYSDDSKSKDSGSYSYSYSYTPSSERGGGKKGKKGSGDSGSYSYEYSYTPSHYTDDYYYSDDYTPYYYSDYYYSSGSYYATPSEESMSEFTRERLNYLPLKDWFSDLPEPTTPAYHVRPTQDVYFKTVQDNIRRLKEHVQNIQKEEISVIDAYGEILSREDAPGAEKPREKDAEADRLEFLDALASVRKQRKQYRALLYDAILQRNNMIEAAELRQEEERQKDLRLWSLGRHKEVDYFLFFLFTFQMVCMLLYIVFVDFGLSTESTLVAERGVVGAGYGLAELSIFHYSSYRNVALMLFAGFGFLMTFVRKYSFSALAYGLLIAAFSIEWGVFWLGLFEQIARFQLEGIGAGLEKFSVGVPHLIMALFAATSVIIAFGSLLGRLDPLQLAFMSIVQTLCFAFNVWAAWNIQQLDLAAGAWRVIDPASALSRGEPGALFGEFLGRVDPGGSLFIHAFGCFFGLAVGALAGRIDADSGDDRDQRAEYHTNTFAFLGTVLLFALFPSFHAAFAAPGTQYRVIFNCVLALTTSCVTAFASSSCLTCSSAASHANRFGPLEIQHAVLAGGILVGSASTYHLPPVGAMVLGVIGGFVSVLSYKYLTPALRGSFKLGDTLGTLSLHGIPGLLSACIGVLLTAIANQLCTGETECLGDTSYPWAVSPTDLYYGLSGSDEAPLLAIMIAITVGMFLIGGLFTGLVIHQVNMRCFTVQPEAADQYQDDKYWHIPQEGYEWKAPRAFS